MPDIITLLVILHNITCYAPLHYLLCSITSNVMYTNFYLIKAKVSMVELRFSLTMLRFSDINVNFGMLTPTCKKYQSGHILSYK